MSRNPEFYNGEWLKDTALLTEELIPKVSFSATVPRDVPEDQAGGGDNRQKSEFKYKTRQVRITLPGCSPINTLMIPNCRIHKETFDYFGKTGVIVGVPMTAIAKLRATLVQDGINVVFEDTGVASDDKFWWSRVGFSPSPAEMDKEYIFILDEENDEEIPYESFPSLFNTVGESVIVNLTCSISLTCKIPRENKGAVDPGIQWRAKISPIQVSVIDIMEFDKPATRVKQRNELGAKDRASSRLLQKARAGRA